MADPLQTAPVGPAVPRSESLTAVIVIYALYLVALFTGGLSMILGVIIAYALRGEAGAVARSHYVFQIRTFWGGGLLILAGLVLIGIGIPLMLIVIGFAVIAVGAVLAGGAHLWQIVRCGVGLYYAANGRGYPEPMTPLI